MPSSQFAYRTSSKESRIDEYVATEDLANFSDDEVKEFDAAVEGVHFRSFVSLVCGFVCSAYVSSDNG